MPLRIARDGQQPTTGGHFRVNIGFVGLGVMGRNIVSRLLAARYRVTGWNRSRDKAQPLIDAGMHFADTPRAVAETSDVVLSIVTDGAAVRAVALGPDGIIAGLKAGAVYADMSTIAPDVSREVAAAFAQKGLAMLDAPISGSPVTLQQGNASVMVGGDAAAFEKIKPVLLAIGPKVTHIGRNGLACQMKIAVNLLLMVEVIAFGEAVALAEKGGGRRHPQERGGVARARLSRSVHPRGKNAGCSAGRRHAAAEGHAAGARSRPQARQPGAAGRCRQRDDECLPRSGHRSSRFRHRTRRLSPPGRADMTSKAEMF